MHFIARRYTEVIWCIKRSISSYMCRLNIILINGYVLNTKNTTTAATNPTTGYSKTVSNLKKQINFTFKSN